MTIETLYFHTVFPVSLHSTKRANSFPANWYWLSNLSKNFFSDEKTYQFVSYVCGNPNPRKQEQLVAILRLQLAGNRINW